MKQKKKRALWVLMCLMTMVCANAQIIVTVDGLKYQLNGAYASVYQNTEGNTSAKINIPATISYEGLTYIVYAIDSQAFNWPRNRSVKEVILPNTIKTIGSSAFRNGAITNVKLSEGVETIGPYAFASPSITSIVIPSSVTQMAGDTFWNCI